MRLITLTSTTSGAVSVNPDHIVTMLTPFEPGDGTTDTLIQLSTREELRVSEGRNLIHKLIGAS